MDTNYTVCEAFLIFFMSVGKSHFTKLLYKNWEEKWCNETESHNFF